MQAASQAHGRTITNISMAMPHTGVVAAAALRDNKLPQVENADVSTSGWSDSQSSLMVSQANLNLSIDAQTVVPVLNVLCAEATGQELLPFNSTAFDPIFRFSPSPSFNRLPGPNNSILDNGSYTNNALYLVLTSGPGHHPMNYSLCSMSMSLREGCSSELSVSTSSSTLNSNYAQHYMSYNQPLNLAQSSTPADWTTLASSWANAVALSTGNVDSNASTPHMLAELVPHGPALDTTRPLMVEALAVLATNTLLDSMVDAPFNGSWPFNTSTLNKAVMQPVMARMSMNDYASGATMPWQNVFTIVLAAVFVISLALFGYLLFISILGPCFSYLRGANRNRSSLGQDCTNLAELFQIALNSPQPGQGSPVGIARENGKLQNTKWHFSRRRCCCREPEQ